jgi:hypothetical protein
MASAAAGALAVALPAIPSATTATAPAAVVVLQPASAVSESSKPGSAVSDSAPAEGGQPRLLLATLPPVTGDAGPAELQVSHLVKAAGLAEAALAEQRALEANRAAADCAGDLDGLGAVQPWVRAGAQFLSCLYDQPRLIGVAARARHSDHPSGHAIDLMTDRERGDRIAACAQANRDELGINYVIWRQRVDNGDGWEPMADRGSPTANHLDHVHISFDHTAPQHGRPNADRCT